MPARPPLADPPAADVPLAQPPPTGTQLDVPSSAQPVPSPDTARQAPVGEVPQHSSGRSAQRPPRRSGRSLVRGVTRRSRVLTTGGTTLRLLVLSCTSEDTTAVDLASGAVVRLRIAWPAGTTPDLSTFEVVDATLAPDPERDDLAQPEAATAATPPIRLGSLRGRRVRRILGRLSAPAGGPLLGFTGPSAPYWEFRGLRPSVALLHPPRGLQLIRRPADGSTWVRFGWDRDDVWLPVEDPRAQRALAGSNQERLGGRALSSALGFVPHYVLVTLSRPREGHCYKVCAGILPRD